MEVSKFKLGSFPAPVELPGYIYRKLQCSCDKQKF